MSSKRRCGTCSVCCHVAPVTALKKPARTDCQYCVAGHYKPCMVYSNRPKACKAYSCSWLGGALHPDLHPDKCGVIFETYRNEAFTPNLYILFGAVVDDDKMHANLHLVDNDIPEGTVIVIATEAYQYVYGGVRERRAWEVVRRGIIEEGEVEVHLKDGVETIKIKEGEQR